MAPSSPASFCCANTSYARINGESGSSTICTLYSGRDTAAHTALEGLERQTRELFDELDRNSRAAHAASLLLPEDDSLRQRLNQFREVAVADEEFLAENPQLFLHASPLASALLRACRADLDETDEALWLTTLKHHALEQLSEEADHGLLGRPTAEDAADLE